MLAKVSTLLILVGFPHKPRTAGKGGRGRDMPSPDKSEFTIELKPEVTGAGTMEHAAVRGVRLAEKGDDRQRD